MVQVRNGGLLTTIQDAGRYGYEHQGIPVSGAMDQTSMRLANILLGNTEDEAVLECTMLGPELMFEADCLFAVTGADMQMQLNQTGLLPYHTYLGRKGDVLHLGCATNGVRSYIAFAGGIQADSVLGSASTDMKCHIGGKDGRKLQQGDRLLFKSPKTELPAMYRRVEDMELSRRKETLIHVIAGPQADYFTEEGIRTFYSETYQIMQESDRMGYRLSGAAIENKSGVDIVSDGITFGSVQVTASGNPIIMMADHQTTGGYAKIATVISADLPILAQMMPGDHIRFEAVSLKEARRYWRRSERQIRRFRRRTN